MSQITLNFTVAMLRSLLKPGHFFPKKYIFFIFCYLLFHCINNDKNNLKNHRLVFEL